MILYSQQVRFILFYKWDNGHILLVLVYVDEIIFTGSSHQSVLQVISDMQTTFDLKDLGEVNYFFCIEATNTNEGLHLSQSKYIVDFLAKQGIETCSRVPTPMVTSHYLLKNACAIIDNDSQYRSIIGALQYIILTRSNIAYLVNKLSQFLSAILEEH